MKGPAAYRVLLLLMMLLGSACVNTASSRHPLPVLLMEDSMTGNWQDQWFLDGNEATLRNSPDGLYFSAGNITKAMDRKAYHAHHAVLWTKDRFQGDLRISYEMTREDQSSYGTTLLYIQAQGIGEPPYAEDIRDWDELREIPAMSTYYNHMNLISLSFRENLRCKRYPWLDKQHYDGPRGLIPPMVEYQGEPILPGKSYRVLVEKRALSLSLTLTSIDEGRILIDHRWDLSRIPDDLNPRILQEGRIGLRHMSTRQMTYRNFRVESL